MNNFIENRKVLFVDDEPELLNAFTSLMRKENLQIKTLQSSVKISEILETDGPFALVLSDQRMPEYDGVQVLKTVRENCSETIRVLITGYSDHTDTINAINLGGINSYIAKPWDDDNVKIQVKDWIAQYNLKQHNKYLLNLLDKENRNLTELLDGTIVQIAQVLSDLTYRVSPQVAIMGTRVKTVGTALLNNLPNISSKERWEIMRSFDLFNIGYALLPAYTQSAVLKKEIGVINNTNIASRNHLIAAGIIKNIPRFAHVARIIELQRKDYNGKGEPQNDNISGEDIPLGARLLHILIDLINASPGISGSKQLLRMEQMPEKYDAGLIKQILGENLTSFDTEEKLLPVGDLRAGMVLINDVRSLTGQLFLKAEVTLNETFINIINQLHAKDPIAEPVAVMCLSEHDIPVPEVHIPVPEAEDKLV